MSESDHLSLAELEAGRVWGSGRERRALCPFCGSDHRPDMAHASLAFNADTGAWHCHRCDRSGLLAEHHTPREPLPRSARARKPRPLPAPRREPSPAELAEQAEKRSTLRRLWAGAVPVGEHEAKAGADYLVGRGLPLLVAVDARVRFAADWYGRAAVVFPVQDAAGRLVAAEGRHCDAGAPKTRSAGRKSSGVFVATPGALEAPAVMLCEGPITALSVAACGFPALALCGRSMPAWLAPRLALRAVYVSLDWHEDGAEAKAVPIYRALAALGATPYRLAPPAGTDWNEYLAAVGLAVMRAELARAVPAALVRLA